MQQIIRHKTFETNSSSMHSLILVNENIFESWKQGDLWFRPDNNKFYTKEDILNSDFFKYNMPDYDTLDELGKAKAFDKFMEEFIDTDYAEFYSYHWIDTETREVYTKEGDKQIALSYYIAG